MGKVIGYEHIQVNTIRVVADTSIQEKSKSPKSEKLSASGNKKIEHNSSKALQERQESCTTTVQYNIGLQIPKTSLPYEVIQIKAEDKQMSAVITYDTGSEFSFCNKDTESMTINIGKARKNIIISTVNTMQS